MCWRYGRHDGAIACRVVECSARDATAGWHQDPWQGSAGEEGVAMDFGDGRGDYGDGDCGALSKGGLGDLGEAGWQLGDGELVTDLEGALADRCEPVR